MASDSEATADGSPSADMPDRKATTAVAVADSKPCLVIVTLHFAPIQARLQGQQDCCLESKWRTENTIAVNNWHTVRLPHTYSGSRKVEGGRHKLHHAIRRSLVTACGIMDSHKPAVVPGL